MKKSVVTVASIVCSFFAATSFAVDYTWQGGSSTDWHNSANWSPNGVPLTANDTATFNAAAAVAIPSTITLRTVTVNNAPVTITVASSATLNFSNSGGLIMDAKADLLIDGDGDITLSRAGTDDLNFADIRPIAGATITLAARISGLPGSGVELNAAGRLVLANPGNLYTGYTRVSTGGGIIQYTTPGALGLGAIRIEQSSPSKIGYSGAGPATVPNPVTLTAGTPLLENAGSGALTFTGDVYATSAGAKTLTFSMPTGQPIILNGNISDSSGTVGITAGPGLLFFNSNASAATGAYTIGADAIFTLGATAIINGATTVNTDGTLAIENGATFQNRTLNMAARSTVSFNPSAAATFAITLPLTNNLTGAGVRWVLPAAATASTITVPGFFRTDGSASIDIIASGLGTVQNTLFVSTFKAGPLPGWFTVNGTPAAYDTTLGVIPVTASGTDSLAALGPSTIQHGPTVANVINQQGSGGGITLAAGLTGIFSLTQDWAGDPALVNFGGKTLATSLIGITAQGNGLTLANGTLTAPSAQTPPAGPAVFPTLPAAPIVWFDFSDTTSVTTGPDNRITLVANRGTRGPALDAAPPADRLGPRYVPNAVNGLAVARSDSNSPQQGLATLGNPGISATAPRTLFVVTARSPVTQNNLYAVYMGLNRNNESFCICERPAQTSFSTFGNDINSPTASPPGHNVLTFISGLDNTPNDGAGYRNGTLVERKPFTMNTTDAPIHILHQPSGNVNATTGHSGPGEIAEMLLFDYTLTETEREAVEAYLMRKWAVAAQRDDVLLALRNDNAAVKFAIPAALADPYGAILSLTKSGPGDVTLSGPVSFTGSLLINDGALTLDIPAGESTVLAQPVSGTGKLIKAGDGDLTLSLTGFHTGGTLVQGGTLYHGDNPGVLGTGPVTLEDGSALDIRYGARAVTVPVAVEGAGPDGLGALRNSNPLIGQINAFNNVTLTGDTALYAVNRFDVRGGAFDFGGHSLTLNGGDQFSIVGSVISGITPDVNVRAENGLFNFESSNFQGSPANLASAAPGAGIALYGMTAPMQWSLLLENNAYLRVNNGTMNTNLNVWAGPVTFAGATGRLNALADGTAVISGPISGPGSLLKEGPGWFWLFNSNNTYAGTTSVTQGNLYVVSPGSLGTSGTNPTIKGEGASFIVRVASAVSPDGWPEAVIKAAIASADAFDANTFLGLDTCYEDLDYSGPYPFVGLKKLGPYKLSLALPAPDLGGVWVYDGELDLSNSGTHNLHNYYVLVGTGGNAAMFPTLRLAHTAIDTIDPGYNRSPSILGVGYSANNRGILHVGENARINGRLRIGDGANAAGAVYQASGVVTNMGGQNYAAGIGVNGYGYYRLDGGELAHKGQTLFGENTGSTAVYEQRGGTALINPGGAPGDGVVGNYYNGTFSTREGVSQFMLSGGTLNLNAHTFTLGEWGGGNNNGYASLTLENDAEMSGITVLTLANRNAAAEAYINLNGGALTLRDYFQKGGNNAAGNTARAAIAFNGGTLRVAPNTSAAVSLVQTRANNSPTLLNVYPGGAVIDTATPTANIVLGEPLRAPAGLGVTAVNITAGGAGFIAPPAVTFSGGNGTGATAFAEIDLNGTLTGIRVTSPGVGYTAAPTVNIRGGGFTTAATATATLGGSLSGGLTKHGPGLLTLTAENTYTGPTVVSDGVLRLGAGAQTLTALTSITVAGGTLDLGGAAITNYNPVTIERGGIVNGGLTAASFTKTGPGDATLSAALAAIVSPAASRDAFIKSLGPIVWYDPSDPTPGNVIVNDAGRVTLLRNKGTLGVSLDAVPYPIGTGIGPLFLSGPGTPSPRGAGVLQVDTNNATLTTITDIPLTGTTARTLVAILARDPDRANVGIGSGGEGQTFEIGTDATKTYLSGIGANRDTQWDQPNIPASNQLIFLAGVNGWNGNFVRGIQAWRCMGEGAPLETLTATWPADMSLTAAPLALSRRGGTVNKGKYGDILVFDRILSETEIIGLKDVLVAKYMAASGGDSGGEETEIPPIAVEGGTLRLAPTLSEDTIARLNPTVWYDPSDASTVTLDGAGRITGLASKGSRPNMNAVTGFANGTANLVPPPLKTGANSDSRTGLPMIGIDANNEGLASASDIGITGNAPRTTVAVFARPDDPPGGGDPVAGPVVSFGAANNSQLWEFGDRHSNVMIGGFGGGNYDLVLTPDNPRRTPDVFIASYDSTTMSFWRTLTEPLFASQGSSLNTSPSPLFIGQRSGVANRVDFRGQIGEILIFDRVLSEPERTDIQNYLIAKWRTVSQSDGTEFDGVTFDVAAGATLDLGRGERSGITVTGNGTIANGTLADGFVISPAGDDAIGVLAFANVTFGTGTEYRLTTIGNDSDCILVDGDLGNLTIVPATDAPITGKTFVIATGNITGAKPTLDGFPDKFKLRQQGPDLLLTCAGGTVMIVR